MQTKAMLGVTALTLGAWVGMVGTGCVDGTERLENGPAAFGLGAPEADSRSARGETAALDLVRYEDALTPQLDPSALAAAMLEGRRRALVKLPVRSDQPFEVTDATSGLAMRVALAGASPTPVELEGSTAVFRDAHRGGDDLVVRVTQEGAEDFVVFDEAPSEAFVDYDLSLDGGVAGLRLVAGTLELLDAGGAPRLRMAPPYLVDRRGSRHDAAVTVEGCDVDTSPAAPWGRAPTHPGADACRVHVSWESQQLEYPAVLDPVWTTTGALATARYQHTANVLADGHVLVAGGAALASAELYDPESGTWAATGSLATGRGTHSASTLGNGLVLAAGGTGVGNVHLVTAELYDPMTGTWTPTDSLETSHYAGPAVVLRDGRVLVPSGGSSNASAELYDPALETWTTTGSLTTARQSHAASVLADGRVLVTGGDGGGGRIATAELYDPALGTWTDATSMGSVRGFHTASVLPDGRVLAVGGLDASNCSYTSELYDPATDSWSPSGNLAEAHFSHTATVLPDGGVLVAAGANCAGFGFTAVSTLYDARTGTWGPTDGLTDGRNLHTASMLADGRVLVAGGYSIGALRSTELYGLGIMLNEIRTAQSNGDVDEYVELTGPAGTSLDGLSILVLGDAEAQGGSIGGDVEAVIDLTGQVIDPNGFFVVAEPTFSLGTADLTATLDFEDADNVTFMLVEGFSGALLDDLDPDDDCVLDSTPWTFVYDLLALVQTPGGGDCTYSPRTVGPDGGAAPGQTFRCPDQAGGWQIGQLDPVGLTDTPGAANACLAAGDACAQGDECATGYCADGVCCDSACGGSVAGDCQACDVAGLEGTCSPEAAGVTCGDATDDACTNPDTCDGAGTCAPNHENAGATCGDQGIACIADDTCDGSGACTDNGFLAAGAGCGDATDDECENPDTCDGAGACTPNHEAEGAACGDQGVDCAVDDTCDGSGACTDNGFQDEGSSCNDGSGACSPAGTCETVGGEEDGGCGCRMVGARPNTPIGACLLAAVALVARRRRRS